MLHFSTKSFEFYPFVHLWLDWIWWNWIGLAQCTIYNSQCMHSAQSNTYCMIPELIHSSFIFLSIASTHLKFLHSQLSIYGIRCTLHTRTILFTFYSRFGFGFGFGFIANVDLVLIKYPEAFLAKSLTRISLFFYTISK